jgi:hypothetical protein
MNLIKNEKIINPAVAGCQKWEILNLYCLKLFALRFKQRKTLPHYAGGFFFERG